MDFSLKQLHFTFSLYYRPAFSILVGAPQVCFWLFYPIIQWVWEHSIKECCSKHWEAQTFSMNILDADQRRKMNSFWRKFLDINKQTLYRRNINRGGKTSLLTAINPSPKFSVGDYGIYVLVKRDLKCSNKCSYTFTLRSKQEANGFWSITKSYMGNHQRWCHDPLDRILLLD